MNGHLFLRLLIRHSPVKGLINVKLVTRRGLWQGKNRRGTICLCLVLALDVVLSPVRTQTGFRFGWRHAPAQRAKGCADLRRIKCNGRWQYLVLDHMPTGALDRGLTLAMPKRDRFRPLPGFAEKERTDESAHCGNRPGSFRDGDRAVSGHGMVLFSQKDDRCVGLGTSRSLATAQNIALRERAVRTPRGARCLILYCR